MTVAGNQTPWTITLGVSVAVSLFAVACRLVGTPLPIDSYWIAVAGAGSAIVSLITIAWLGSGTGGRGWGQILGTAALVGSVWFLFLGVAYQVACLLALRIDILSYSESGFVNDILRIKLGLPIYAPPLENQSTVYTPGSQILTAWVAGLFGDPLDPRTLRAAQFLYVILAVLAATAAADRLARLVAGDRYRQPWLWMAWWAPAIFMVATEPRFNPYTISLNSDGLALCISMIGFLLMSRHALAPRRWHVIAMIVLPAMGFFVKQNLLALIGVFTLYLVVGGFGSWMAVTFLAAAGVLGTAAVAAAYAMWGPDFWFWAVTSYAPKAVSIPRSIQHLLGAGAYLALGLSTGLILLERQLASAHRRAMGIWLAWLALLSLQAYTSGFAWAANHLGPSVLMAFVWFAVATAWLWPTPEDRNDSWRYAATQAIAIALVVGILGGLGFAREPRSPVPRDMERYAQAIEREFAAGDTSRILMDYGSWLYAKGGVAMKDRGFATHVHLEPNQAIARDMLVGTIDRIQRRVYDKILVRELDTGRSSYDFLNRGSGIREAIHAQYREVRRIPAVEGVGQWWPRHMLDEIQVFELRDLTVGRTPLETGDAAEPKR